MCISRSAALRKRELNKYRNVVLTMLIGRTLARRQLDFRDLGRPARDGPGRGTVSIHPDSTLPRPEFPVRDRVEMDLANCGGFIWCA